MLKQPFKPQISQIYADFFRDNRGKHSGLVWVAGFVLMLVVAGCFGGGASGDGAGASLDPTGAEAVVDASGATGDEADTIEGAMVEETGVTIFTEDNRPERLRSMTGSWNTDWTRRTIEYDEILSGGPPRDGIASIDEPTFVRAEDAAFWLQPNEPVISLEIDGLARAYPIQVLTWHEIVNDTLAGVPVAVTFCPLCNSALVFDRRFDGASVDDAFEFGTSGLLRNSDLIMYDRTTETLWQQFTGEGLVGELAGERLTFVPSSLVSFADFRRAFPEGEILSKETGFARDYGRNPYAGYDSVDSTPFLFDGELDGRLLPMARVVTVSLSDTGGADGDDVDVAYPVELLADVGVIHDTQGGQDLVVFHRDGTSSALGASLIANGDDVGATGVFDPNLDGQKLTFTVGDGDDGDSIVDEQSGSTWNVLGQAIDGEFAGRSLAPIVHADHFWFSWAAFKPDTVIYTQ